MCHCNFVGSLLSCLVRYQKILWEYSFGSRNLLNFNCHTMKFHNCHHANRYFCNIFQKLQNSTDIQSARVTRSQKETRENSQKGGENPQDSAKSIGKSFGARPREECENCNEMVSNMTTHKKPCKLYFKFLEKAGMGFKCLFCQLKSESKHRLYR